MELIDDPAVRARAEATFDLYRTAKVIMRQNLRHRFPEESEAQIDQRLLRWLRKDSVSSPRQRRQQQ